MHTYPVEVQHQKLWCTAHTGKARGQRLRVLPVYGWWSVSQCYESHLHIPTIEQVRSRTDQSRKPCFALKVITTRFYTILLVKWNGCCHGYSWRRKNSLPIYMRVPGNHLNNAQETNLIWNRVVNQLQECKRLLERSFNRAADNGFVGDLGSLCAVNSRRGSCIC